jgi:hypothetical protein
LTIGKGFLIAHCLLFIAHFLSKGQSANVKETAADFLIKKEKLKINFIAFLCGKNKVP